MKILDYGCGNARYCNFISERLADFTYYGVEPPGSPVSQGAIDGARRAYGIKPYVKLGFIGEEVEAEALQQVDGVVLGSIFTHLLFDQFEAICAKFQPILDRGGKVVFSVFLDQVSRWGTNNAYQHKECYSAVWYTQEMLDKYAAKNKVTIQLKETFPAGAGHKIFCMTRNIS
jgi:SAM-dependent methyltransferase